MSQRDAVRMTDDEISEFLGGRRVMNPATIDPDGRPHLIAIWYGWAPDGRLGFATYGR